jgi:uncharacterized protein
VKSTLSLVEARRIALHAQGFRQQDRTAKPTWAKLANTIAEMQLLQIDSVNVLVRSHYLPLFARLGNYDRAKLDSRTLAPTKRHVFECWAHEASLVPLELHPLMRWRMQRARDGDGTYAHMDRFATEEKTFLADTLKFIGKNGPTRASEIPGSGKSAGGWWGWSKGKLAAECLFDHGLLTTASRQGFERLYELPEKVIPAEILALPTPREQDAQLDLIVRAARSLGIATELDLRDYFRLSPADARRAITAATESGALIPVTVESWKKPAFLHRETKLPRSAGASTLLSPFDPLVWNRDRAERLFNFHYRIELYTPEAKRKFGYYVLPFLHGERLVGRLCLKADRAAGKLLVNTAHREDDVEVDAIAPALATELQRMATWLGLGGIQTTKSGTLAKAVAKFL